MSACQTGLSRTLIGMASEVSWSMKEGSPESDSIAMIDRDECERARVARDRHYDGRFFSGVRTTRIYCRPVCPVRPVKSANVTFYPSAAAAEAAGFRPCLRCQPEAAPFSPAWKGSRTTVERALRLIDGGALDSQGIEELAIRLGIGSRQLSRLFAKYLGASPVQVAQTARVQRAKRLLDRTKPPIAEIALRAGFGSLRRFNTVFAKVYRRPPREVRRTQLRAPAKTTLSLLHLACP